MVTSTVIIHGLNDKKEVIHYIVQQFKNVDTE